MAVYQFRCPHCKIVFGFAGSGREAEVMARCPVCDAPGELAQEIVASFGSLEGEQPPKNGEVAAPNPECDVDLAEGLMGGEWMAASRCGRG